MIIEKLETLLADDQENAAKELLKDIYLNDFYFFSKRLLGYKDLEREVHDQFIQVFESKAKRKIIVMPRGTFKSSLGSISYPVWRLEQDPNLTILLDSELYTNSKNFLREIKGHYASNKFIEVFGDRRGEKWDEGEIILSSRTQNRKEASITVGGIGTTKIGQHFDLIIADDMNSPENSETPEKCQKVIDHMRYNLNILNPGGEYVIIGTRYSELDLIGFCLKEILSEPLMAEGKMEFYKSKDDECQQMI